MEISIKKGVPYNCLMFEVRCKQECVSDGVRHTNKCPYDNYSKGANAMANSKIPKGYQGVYAKNSNGEDTLIMVMSEKSMTGATPKGANTMAEKKTTGGKAAADSGNQNNNNGGFQPTFRKYKDMTESEQAAFRQGAKTSENKVKERLGFTKPKN